MGVTSNRKSALRKLSLMLSKEREEKKREALQKVLLAALTHAVKMSPVDTGLYRASHRISFNQPELGWAPPDSAVGKGEQELGVVLSKGIRKITSMRDLPRNGAFLSNSLKYAQAIEHGHSGQAPQGVYAQVEQIVKDEIARIARGGK